MTERTLSGINRPTVTAMVATGDLETATDAAALDIGEEEVVTAAEEIEVDIEGKEVKEKK